MPLATGTRLGPYEILSLLGEGGMGEVYKARDTRLDRIVAVKVSKEQFSERFEREARVVAALNHPHICTLHDVGPNYLVMEFVEGQPLRGPLPVEQALKYAAQICEALDNAHRNNVTHRDLKPANILVTKAGVKLLDFGLARMEDGSVDSTLTVKGEVMGTPAYMAPEQWEGKRGDARSDIYGFGCVLYEILTGKRAAQDRGPVEPKGIDAIIRKCMENDPEERWQSARDVKAALALGVESAPPPAAPNPWRERVAWIAAAAAIAAALFFALRPPAAPATGSDPISFTITPPEDAAFSGRTNTTVSAPQFALSPDGRQLVFVAASPGGKSMLWLRSLSQANPRPMPDTEAGHEPFWSPDSRWVGFFTDDGKLKKVLASGGPARVLAGVADSRGGSWASDDTIIFGSGAGSLSRVAAAGGTVTVAIPLDASRQEGSHRWPQFLPDGRHFLYSVRGGLAEQSGIYAGSLDGKTTKLLVPGNTTNGLYDSSGYLVFVSGETLMGQVFHPDSLELSGQPFAVEEKVGRASNGYTAMSLSSTGVFAYSGILSEPGRLTWFDRSGQALDSVGPAGDYADFRLSPSGAQLAAALVDGKSSVPNIWLMDLTRGSTALFTFGSALNASPVWSPDGSRIVYRTTRKGGLFEFYGKSAGGGGKEELVMSEQAMRATGAQTINQVLSDYSPDGRTLLYSVTAGYDLDLWVLPLAVGSKAVSLLTAPGDQLHGNFSPDGALVAYSSNESGRFEIQVQTFPLSDRQWTVSNNGGYEPRWRSDGREIYYLSEDRKLMAVPVGPGPTFGAPKALFQTRVTAGVNPVRTHYVPARDGQKFLINTQSGGASATPITVVLNWTTGLKK